MTQTDYITGIEDRVQDVEEKLTAAIKLQCLQSALTEYNKRRPLVVVEEATGDGTAFLEIPDGWESGFSELRRVEALDSDDRPEEIPSQEWSVILNPAPEAETVFFYPDNTVDGTTYRLTYTQAHTIGVSRSSVPSGDDAALMDLAASYAALRLAAAYFDAVDQQVGAVTVDNKARADYYRGLAKDLRQSFDQLFSGNAKSGQGKLKTWVRESTGLFH